MAQGIVQKLIGDPKRGVRNGFIRPTTPTGAVIGGAKDGMVQIRVDSSGAIGAAATREFPIRLARTVNIFPGAK